jgi:hypothetical protein
MRSVHGSRCSSRGRSTECRSGVDRGHRIAAVRRVVPGEVRRAGAAARISRAVVQAARRGRESRLRESRGWVELRSVSG